MKNNDIYSQKNLERFAKDLLYYLYHKKSYRSDKYYIERLSDNVLIYTLNKRYTVDENDYTYKFRDVPIKVEDNIKVEEWLTYYNKKTLSFTMDCILDEYLYYYDAPGHEEVSKRVNKIFEKHGFYLDFGSNTSVFAWTKEDYPHGL